MLNTIINIETCFEGEGKGRRLFAAFSQRRGNSLKSAAVLPDGTWRPENYGRRNREENAEILPAESLKRIFARAAQARQPGTSSRRRTGLHHILGNGASMQNAGIIR